MLTEFILALAAATNGATHTIEYGRVTILINSQWQEHEEYTRNDRIWFEIPSPEEPRVRAVLWIQAFHGQSVEHRIKKRYFWPIRPYKQILAADNRDACALSTSEDAGRWVVIDRLADRGDLTLHVRISWRTDVLPAGITQQWLIDQANAVATSVDIDGQSIGAIGRVAEIQTPGAGVTLIGSAK
jgi:hypothetical protein